MIPEIKDGLAVFTDPRGTERGRIPVTWTRERSYTGVSGEGYGYDAHADIYQRARYVLLDRPGITRVIDAPCGSGYGSEILARVGWTVMGIDNSATAIRFARLRAEAAWFVCADMSAADLGDNGPAREADAIVSIEGLEHVEREAAPLVCANFARWLRPGGTLFLSTPDRRYSDGTNPYHCAEYVYEEIAPMLTVAGFGAVERFTLPSSPTLVVLATNGDGT